MTVVLTEAQATAMLRDAALGYAAAGQPVFPTHPAGAEVKRPADGVRWRTQASTDPERIERWWARWPYAIGLPTGVLVDVLDIDAKPGRPNGYRVLELLDGLGMLDGAVRWARTPSGGSHAYFPASGDCPNTTYARHGVDLRGSGGYVLAPPSYIETEAYAGWYRHVEAKPDLGPSAPLDWRRMDALLVGPRREHVTPSGSGPSWLLAALVAEMGAAVPGERNSTLFRKVCRALEYGLDIAPLEQAARRVGLTQDEIARTVASAVTTTERKKP